MRFTYSLPFFLFLFAFSTAAQPPAPTNSAQPAQAKAQGDTAPFTISTGTQLVVRAVSVKDKKGNPIEGLTANDFTVTEDGTLQKISICEFHRLDGIDNGATPGVTPESVKQLSADSPSAPRPVEDQYRDHRLLVLYFDMTTMPISDQLRAFDAARSFIAAQMSPQDLVAVMTFAGGAVRTEHDFTGDRAALLKTIHSLVIGEGQGVTGDANDASSSNNGASFGQDDGEFNIFNTDRQLAALQTATGILSKVREKKALLYFASGLRLNGLSNHAQLQATINSAIRSGVALWPIDARGLVAQPPLGDASAGAPGGIGMYSGASRSAAASNFDRSQDTLWTLASDTGGKALLNYNDLASGIVQAEQSISSYYLVGYYTTNRSSDGRFRRLKISLNNGISANLDYLPGYYARKTFAKFTSTDKERQLEEALMLEDPMTELTIALDVYYFQLNHAEYFVPLAVTIPGKELWLARRGGAEHTVVDFIGEVKDEFGMTIANLRDKVDVKLSGKSADELAKHPVDYEAGFTLFPGKYTIKFLARDAETGRIGTYQTHFIIPNLSKEAAQVPISSIVLSSQRVDNKDALFTSKKGSRDLANPLANGTQKLIPSVNRVFHASRPMYVYLQAYQSTAEDTQPLAASVTLYKKDAKAWESPLLVTGARPGAGLRTTPIQFTIGMDKLPAGQYQCQVSVLNPTTHKASFWQTTIMLVP